MRREPLLLLAVVVVGCATMRVGSYVATGVDLAAYRTFDWGPRDELPVGDARLDNNPFFVDYFEGAVERGLFARGLSRDVTSPDLRVHYHATVERRMDVDAVDRHHGICTGDNCDPRVTVYDAGTWVLDVVDARTNRLVWRAWSRDDIEAALEDQDLLERQIDEAVRRMLARLPSRRDAPRPAVN